jgi:hypothetical protein
MLKIKYSLLSTELQYFIFFQKNASIKIFYVIYCYFKLQYKLFLLIYEKVYILLNFI